MIPESEYDLDSLTIVSMAAYMAEEGSEMQYYLYGLMKAMKTNCQIEVRTNVTMQTPGIDWENVISQSVSMTFTVEVKQKSPFRPTPN